MSNSTQVPFKQLQLLLQAEERVFFELYNNGILDAGQAYVRSQIAMSNTLAMCGWRYDDYELAQEAQAAVDALLRAYIAQTEKQSDQDK